LPASGSSGRWLRRSGAPYLFPAAAALLAALALWAGRGRLSSCGSTLESPDTQLRRALANQTRAYLDDIYGFRAGGTLELAPVRFREVVTSVEGERATVVAVLDAEGRASWRDQSASLSYVGRERFHMKPCSIALWCAEGDQFKRLRGVLLLLFRRADAFNARDAAAYASLVSERYQEQGLGRAMLLERIGADFRDGPPARVRVVGWQVRVERDTSEVGEDYEIALAGKAPRRLRARYQLALEESRWRIVGGL
jgi:hypothetical protein